MIDGITVLTEKVVQTGGFDIRLFVSGILILLLSSILTIIIFEEYGISFLHLFPAFFIFVSFVLIASSSTPIKTYNEYQVLMDENVSLIEFNSQFEIEQQAGVVYTIRDKEFIVKE